MAVLLDEYLNKLSQFKKHARNTCPDVRFIDDIIDPWFDEIAPARAYQYGVKGMTRFGARGVFAQQINCYSRWERFKEMDFHVDWTDTMRDMFGFGVIMNIVIGKAPTKVEWSEMVWGSMGSAEEIFEVMVARLWERDVLAGVDSMALALPYKMWVEFWKEWSRAR
jgi:hypothetical protein